MSLSNFIFSLKNRLARPLSVARLRLQFHPAVQLYVWICLALLTQSAKDFVLVLLAALTVLLALNSHPARLIDLLRRTRWIVIFILLINAYATPGEPAWEQLGMWSPVAAGLLEGGRQLFRLLIVLASLSILLSRLSEAQLLNGLYSLLLPLQIFRLSRARIAVRLALTLKYSEDALQDKMGEISVKLEHILTPVKCVPNSLELHLLKYTSCDLLLLVCVTAVLLGVWF